MKILKLCNVQHKEERMTTGTLPPTKGAGRTKIVLLIVLVLSAFSVFAPTSFPSTNSAPIELSRKTDEPLEDVDNVKERRPRLVGPPPGFSYFDTQRTNSATGSAAKPQFEQHINQIRDAITELAKRNHNKPLYDHGNQSMGHRPSFLPPIEYQSSSRILIMVLSDQRNFVKRQAIRETWGRHHTNVVFIVGHADCGDETDAQSCQATAHSFLVQEQLLYNDLLEVPHLEHYRGLPEKLLHAYDWALHQKTNRPAIDDADIRWFCKVDDDIFVRVQSLEDYLLQYNHQMPLVIGKINERTNVHRTGKWKENVEDYPHSFYPYWPQGSTGHIISRSTVEYLVANMDKLHRYQGEDVSLGIWLHEATKASKKNKVPSGILEDQIARATRDKALHHVTYIDANDIMTNEGATRCRVLHMLIVGHDIGANQQLNCRNFADERAPEVVWRHRRAGYQPPNPNR